MEEIQQDNFNEYHKNTNLKIEEKICNIQNGQRINKSNISRTLKTQRTNIEYEIP